MFDFGFERQEIIIKEENFALGQFHDITIKRQDKGSKVIVWVCFIFDLYLIFAFNWSRFFYRSMIMNPKYILIKQTTKQMYNLTESKAFMLVEMKAWTQAKVL